MKILDKINVPLLVICAGVAMIFLTGYLVSVSNRAEKRPDIKGLWILQREEGNEWASDKPVHAPAGSKVYLYAVFSGITASGEEGYYSEWRKIEIGGRKIPESSLAVWDERWGKAFALWFRVERNLNFAYSDVFAPEYGFGWRHKADIRRREIKESSPNTPNIGEMHYKVRLELRDKNRLIAKHETPGADQINSSGSFDGIMKVRIGPDVLIDNTVRQNSKHLPLS